MKLIVAIAAALLMQHSVAMACPGHAIGGRIELIVGAEFVVAGSVVDCRKVQLGIPDSDNTALEISVKVTDQIHGAVAAIMQGGKLKVVSPGHGVQPTGYCDYLLEENGKFLFGLAVLKIQNESLTKYHKESKVPENGKFPTPPILTLKDTLVVSQPNHCESSLIFGASDRMIAQTKQVFDGVGSLQSELKKLRQLRSLEGNLLD